MTRASISLTEPNDDWIHIRAKLIAAEQSVERDGWDERTPEDILASFKAKARKLGKL